MTSHKGAFMLDRDAIPGGGRWCKLINLYRDTKTGRPIADIFDSNGSIRLGCPVIYDVSSPDGSVVEIRPTVAPQKEYKDALEEIASGVDVFVIFPEGSHALPVVVGQTLNLAASQKYQLAKGGRSSTGIGGGLAGAVGEGDAMTIINDIRVSYNRDGTYGIDTSEPGASVKVHVGEGALFEVYHSKYTDASPHPQFTINDHEHLLLGHNTKEHLEAYRNALHELRQVVLHQQSQLNAIKAGLAGITTPESAVAKLNALAVTLGGTTTPPTSFIRAEAEDLKDLNNVLSGTFKVPNKPYNGGRYERT